jgi:cytoskeletal protein RodZ
MRTTWRAIVLLTFLSLLAIGTTLSALRVAAQERPPEPAPSTEPASSPEPATPPESSNPAQTPRDGTEAAPAEGEGVVSDSTLEIPPDLKMNADDTVSFPVDI